LLRPPTESFCSDAPSVPSVPALSLKSRARRYPPSLTDFTFSQSFHFSLSKHTPHHYQADSLSPRTLDFFFFFVGVSSRLNPHCPHFCSYSSIPGPDSRPPQSIFDPFLLLPSTGEPPFPSSRPQGRDRFPPWLPWKRPFGCF